MRGLGFPILVKEKFSRVFGRGVQIIIEAARFLVRWCDETNQGFSQFRFLARPSLERGDDGDGFHDLIQFKSVGRVSPLPAAFVISATARTEWRVLLNPCLSVFIRG